MWFNLNPALIFMGDTGSLFVGFVLAAMTLRAGQLASPESFPLVPTLLLIVPLFDTFDAVRRRSIAAARTSRSVADFLLAIRGRVFSPDGMHIHHRLIRAGFSTRGAVALLWAAAVTFAVSGCLIPRDPFLGLMLLGTFVIVAWRGFRLLGSRVEGSLPAPRPISMPGTTLAGTDTLEAAESHHAV